MALKGNAALRWTPPGGTETTHELAWPLVLEPKARVRTRAWRAFGRDFSEQAAVSLDHTAWEYRATIRFDDEPAELLDVLEDGADGIEIKYYPDLNEGDFFSTWLIEAGQVQEIEWEEERGTSEYRVPVTLRTQTADFEEILANTVTY